MLPECYELVSGKDIMQGDLIRSVPILKPPRDLAVPAEVDEESEAQDIDVSVEDVVILSQSCDIVGNKSDVWLVVLCQVWTADQIGKTNHFLADGYGKEQLKQGNIPGYYLLPPFKTDQYEMPLSIVSFREVWSLPLGYVLDLAGRERTRLRIKSPYREHLAQAFARYFMRVSTEYNEILGSFASPKDEREILKLFAKLDESKKKEMIAALQAFQSNE